MSKWIFERTDYRTHPCKKRNFFAPKLIIVSEDAAYDMGVSFHYFYET